MTKSTLNDLTCRDDDLLVNQFGVLLNASGVYPFAAKMRTPRPHPPRI